MYNFRPYSFSRLFGTGKCPWALREKYHRGNGNNELLDAYEVSPSGFGSSFHDLAEEFVKTLFEIHKTRKVVEEDLQTELAREVLDEFFAEARASLQFYDDLREIFVDGFAKHFVLNVNNYYGSEVAFAIDDAKDPVGWNDESALFRGRLDYVEYDAEEKLLTIHDYKTNLNVPAWGEFEKSDITTQLELYAWLAWTILSKDIPDLDQVNVGALFVRYGAWRGFKLYAEQMPKIEEKLMNRIERLESLKKFHAIPCSHCQYCEFLTTSCPVKSKISTITSAQAASSVLRDLLRLEELVAIRKDQLRQYVNSTERPVKTGDLQIGYTPTTSTKYHQVEALRILRESEVDFDHMFTVNKTNLRKIPKEIRDKVEEETMYMDGGTRFEVTKTQ